MGPIGPPGPVIPAGGPLAPAPGPPAPGPPRPPIIPAIIMEAASAPFPPGGAGAAAGAAEAAGAAAAAGGAGVAAGAGVEAGAAGGADAVEELPPPQPASPNRTSPTAAHKMSRRMHHLHADKASPDLYLLFGVKRISPNSVSYTHLRAHETPEHLVCR